MANRVPTPKRYESVFLRKHFPELSNMQIAQRLNISEKSVRRYNKQYTIKGHLRDDYSKCGRHKKLNSRGERGLTREFLQDPRLPLTTCVSNYNACLEKNDQLSYITAWSSLQRMILFAEYSGKNHYSILAILGLEKLFTLQIKIKLNLIGSNMHFLMRLRYSPILNLADYILEKDLKQIHPRTQSSQQRHMEAFQ